MKRRIIITCTLIFIFLASCGGPDALVINTVNQDGSVDRKIILTWDKEDFDLYDCQVPVDSTWIIERKIDISEKGDTTFTLTAEKHFESVEMINEDYSEYGGPNSRLKREAIFISRFRWFNTIYYFEEKIGNVIDGYPPELYFTPEELNIFYMPEGMIEELAEGEDSVRIKEIVDLVDEKKEDWLLASLLKASFNQIAEFSEMSIGEPIDIELLRSKEDHFTEIVSDFDGDESEIVDTIMGRGYYAKHKTIIDTALTVVEDKFDIAFDTDNYLVQTVMPGKLMATNGYIDSDSNILWKVDGDCVLSSEYRMWAESSVPNRWAWIVSIMFVLFVITGLLSRRRGRAGGR